MTTTQIQLPSIQTITVGVTEKTKQWCTERDHPWVTYNPWLDRSYCRCGKRQAEGEHPQDEEAKRSIFHDCKSGGPCRCYVAEKPVNS